MVLAQRSILCCYIPLIVFFIDFTMFYIHVSAVSLKESDAIIDNPSENVSLEIIY